MDEIEKVNTITLSILEEAPMYHRWIVERIKPYLGDPVLEVGCGTGNLTGLLLQQGEIVATDFNPSYLETVARKFGRHPHLKGVFRWDIRLPPPAEMRGKFRSVVCSNVLEHVEEDDKALAGLRSLLRPGGRLVLLVPALKWLYNPLDHELGHLRRYNKKEVEDLLLGQGFRICQITFFNFFGVLGWFVNGTVLRRRLLPLKQVRAFNKLVPALMKMERFLPRVMGQSLIAIGEKDQAEGSH